jgi:protein phosphatase
MNYQMIRNSTTSIAKPFERQHSTKMPYRMKHHKRTTVHHPHRPSPFATSYRSIANERHPDRNEDSIILDEAGGLFAVFDGVGGSAAAEIASQTAAHASQQVWKRVLNKGQSHRRRAHTLLIDCPQPELCYTLEQLLLEADDQVRTTGAERAGTDNLATTAALVAFCKHRNSNDYTMAYAHVGDSRIYLLRGEEKLQRLTNDDGLLTKLVENQIVNEEHAHRIDQAMRADQLSDAEYNYFRYRGGITQAIGGPIPPSIHTAQITIYPSDRILLCTDGIHDNLTDEEIEDIMRTTPRTTIAHRLVERARERSREDRTYTIRSKPDDMSAIVITCRF